MEADDGPQKRYPDLRAPGGGKFLHLDRLTFLGRVQELIPDCFQDLYRRATTGEDEDTAIRTWGDRWNLPDPWIVQVARDTYRIYSDPNVHRQRRAAWLRLYELNRGLIQKGEVTMKAPPYGEEGLEPPFEHLRFYVQKPLAELTVEAIRRHPLLPTPALPFTFSDYDPEIDHEADADQRLHDAWEKYKEARRRQARRDGATAPRRKRARSGARDLHFAWLARWQVREETHQEIARDPGEDADPVRPKTVGVAVRTTADRIGLTRRTDFPD